MVRRPFEWIGIFLAAAIIPCLTRRGCLRLASFLAGCGMLFLRRDRSVAQANLRIMYGSRITPRRERVIVYHCFRNLAVVLVTLFWISRKSRERIARLTVTDPAMIALMKQAQPSVNVSAHMGNWELLSQTSVLNGVPIMTVAKEIGSSAMNSLLEKIRCAIGQIIVPKDGALKRLVYAMRDNISLGLVVDQHTSIREGGVWLTFFGLPVSVSIAPAALSRKFNAPIIVAWSRPLKNGTYKTVFLKKFDPAPDPDDTVRSQEIVDLFERVIRRHPSCWTLNYRRWRTMRPGDDPARYPYYAKAKKEPRTGALTNRENSGSADDKFTSGSRSGSRGRA